MLRHHCQCSKELTRYEQRLNNRKTQLLYSAICCQAQGVRRPQPSASCALVQLHASDKLQGNKRRIRELSVHGNTVQQPLRACHTNCVWVAWVSSICNLWQAFSMTE